MGFGSFIKSGFNFVKNTAGDVINVGEDIVTKSKEVVQDIASGNISVSTFTKIIDIINAPTFFVTGNVLNLIDETTGIGIDIDLTNGITDEIENLLIAVGIKEDELNNLKQSNPDKTKDYGDILERTKKFEKLKDQREAFALAKKVLEDVFDLIEAFLKGEKKITSLKDLANFIGLLVDLLRAIINAFVQSIPILNNLIVTIIETFEVVLEFVLKNKSIIEMIIIALPLIPFVLLINKLISDF